MFSFVPRAGTGTLDGSGVVVTPAMRTMRPSFVRVSVVSSIGFA